MKTIKLFGELGKRFGSEHRFDVKTTAEAIKALCANFKGFRQFMIDAEENNMRFKVVNGAAVLDDASQVHEPASREIKIIPVIVGASAETRILVGAVLIAAAIFIPGSAVIFGTSVASIVGSIGVSLVVGGVAQLLSPPPKADSPKEQNNEPSYNFNGPVNTAAQGHPVPVLYGEAIIGGAIISAGISLEQIKQGFQRVQQVATKTLYRRFQDGFSIGYFKGFSSGDETTPPTGFFQQEILANTPVFGNPNFNRVHTIRFSYYVWVEVPA